MNPASEERSPPSRELTVPPTVIAVVVSYNSARDLPACLVSIQAQHGVRTEIRVVDNASHDESVALVRRDFPSVALIANGVNVGFARANNQAIEPGTAEFYALVNPDAVLSPGAVAGCVEAMRRDRRVGVAATRLINLDGSLQPSCHSFLGLRNLFGETFGLHRLLPGVRSLSSLDMPWFAHDAVAEVDWIQGAFLVVRGEVVRATGAFDPDFFMYGEEMDWCRRIRDAGWAVLFLPAPDVVHVGGASSAPIAGPMLVERLKGRIRFLRKHRGPVVATAARALIAMSVLLRFAWREIRTWGHRVSGRTTAESDPQTQTMFRAAMRWVVRGLPV